MQHKSRTAQEVSVKVAFCMSFIKNVCSDFYFDSPASIYSATTPTRALGRRFSNQKRFLKTKDSDVFLQTDQ